MCVQEVAKGDEESKGAGEGGEGAPTGLGSTSQPREQEREPEEAGGNSQNPSAVLI